MNTGEDPRDLAQIREDLASPDAEARRLAVERAALLSSLTAVPFLSASLGDPSWRVRKAAIDGMVGVADDVLAGRALIEALADEDNAGRRNASVDALVRRGRIMVPLLIDASRDSCVDVRKLVVDALAGIGSLEAVPRLGELLRDPDTNVRAATADALGAIGGHDSERKLERLALREGEDTLVRLSALRGLARLEMPLSADALAGVLSDPLLRPAAFAVLGRSGDPEAAESLLKGLQLSARSAREAAVEALVQLVGAIEANEVERLCARIRETSQESPRLLDDAFDGLESGELTTRLLWVQFLGLLRNPRAVVPMLRAGRDEALRDVVLGALEGFADGAADVLDEAWEGLDSDGRRLACELLGGAGSPRTLDRLLIALGDEDPEVRTAAASALGRRADPVACEPLVLQLRALVADDEPDWVEEREALTEALGALAQATPTATRTVLGRLREALTDGAEPLRLATAQILGRVGGAEHGALIALLIQDPSPRVRAEAARALARIASGRVPEDLHLAMADESPDVRRAVAAALGEIDAPAVLHDLEHMLADDDVLVRAAAVRSLGTLAVRAEESLREELRRLLECALDDEAPVALSAVEAFAGLSSTVSLAPLGALINRPDPELVQALVGVWRRHAGSDELAQLIPLVAHPHWGVRADTIEALAERRVAAAVPAMLRNLEQERDEYVRQVLLRALDRLEP